MNELVTRAHAQNMRAAALMSATMACFTLNDAIIKLMSARLPVGEMLFVRGLLIAAILLVAMRVARERVDPARITSKANLARSALEIAITFTFLSGVVRLPLAIATVLVFTAPIFITLMGWLFFGERVGPRRWSAVLAGFVGVVLVAEPQAGFEPAMLLPLAAAVMIAGRDVLTRLVPAELPARAIAFSSGAAVTLGGLATAPLGGWTTPTWPYVAGMVACAILLAIAYTLIVSAVRLGDMSFTAPFRYFSILLAALLGWSIWGDVPSPMAILGGLIIIGSGLFIFHRERKLEDA